jgi:predicted transcriptional regulator
MTKTSKVKTAVSISARLAGEADGLAREMGVTRSQLYSMALGDFIRRRENVRILEQLNAAHGGDPDPEEERLLSNARRYSRRMLAEDER